MHRTARLWASLLLASGLLFGCGPKQPLKTEVIVMGAIHKKHKTSASYSLPKLEAAIRAINPDYILAEIPPGRLKAAQQGFAETGRVTEKRVAVFPEYTDVIFPLQREMKFKLIGTAAWTQELADFRSKRLREISSDPKRAQQWQEHQAAYRNYSRQIGSRADDPKFIHSNAYDALVRAAQKPYQRYFDGELGAGGWTNINNAHYALIDNALDKVRGKSTRVLIIFGAWHKYWFLQQLKKREDVQIINAASFF